MLDIYYVVSAFSNVGMARTHDTEPVGSQVPVDVFRQLSASRPSREDLKRVDGSAYQGNNVWVREEFPQYNLLAKLL